MVEERQGNEPLSLLNHRTHSEQLRADVALADVDSLTITLPAVGSAASHRRVLEAVAVEVAPHIGWESGWDGVAALQRAGALQQAQ